MKPKTFAIIISSILISNTMNAQKIDRTRPPKPGPAPKVNIGKAEKFTLDNGLKVIVVENHKLPVVSIQLYVDADPMLEKEKTGLSSVFGEMLSAGSHEISKEKLDAFIDYHGASFSTSASGFSLYCMKKYIDPLTAMVSKVVLNPAFDKKEFDKVIQRRISSLEASRNNPEFMAGNAASAVMYGKNHPYGEITTEQTLKNLTPEDCRYVFNTYYKPNISYLIIVGDIVLEEAKHLANSYFGDWKKGEVPSHNYEIPSLPEKNQFVLVDKKQAVQSYIEIAYPLSLSLADEDIIPAMLANGILGSSGFQARLMRNIREDKGYTYGAYSSLKPDKICAHFSASASVRNNVTDSAIIEFLKEIKRMTTEKVTDQELENVKNYYSGNFALGLESPQTIARYALNIERYKLPDDFYENYLRKVAATTPDDILNASRKYFKPDNLYVVVAGNKAEIEEKLKSLAPEGKLRYYDAFGNELKDTPPIPENITAQSIIEKYIESIGGRKKLSKVKSLQIKMKASIQGMQLDVVMSRQKPNKFAMVIGNNGMILQKQVFDGTTGRTAGMQGNKELTGEELEDLKNQSVMFAELSYLSNNYQLKLNGIENINGKNAYVIEVTPPKGKSFTEYFDVNTGYKLRTIKTTQNPQIGEITVTVDLDDYKPTDGIYFPHTYTQSFGQQSLRMEVYSIELNKKLSADTFK